MRNILDSVHNQLRYPTIILLITIIVLNAKFGGGLDKLTFKTPQENVNQFLQQVDSAGPKTKGEEKIGADLFDSNRIEANMMYELGDKEYLIYIFIDDNKGIEDMTDLERSLDTYKGLKGSMAVYSLNFEDLINTPDSYLMEEVPLVMKVERTSDAQGKITYMPTAIFHTNDEFKKAFDTTSPTETTKKKDSKDVDIDSKEKTTSNSDDVIQKDTEDVGEKTKPDTDNSFADKLMSIFNNWR